jgi:hypothetical protein
VVVDDVLLKNSVCWKILTVLKNVIFISILFLFHCFKNKGFTSIFHDDSEVNTLYSSINVKFKPYFSLFVFCGFSMG